MKTYVTLYLADDHQIVIDGLKLLIGSEDHIKIVGYANDGATACAELLERKPDLALIDFSMPKMDGLELILSLRKKLPDTKFIMLSMHDKLKDIKAAQNGGASGYILKNMNRAELMKCLNTVLAGNTYFPDLKIKPIDDNKTIFTSREKEVIKLMLEAVKSIEIASKLNISLATVDTHRKNIHRKASTKNSLALKIFIDENQIKL